MLPTGVPEDEEDEDIPFMDERTPIMMVRPRAGYVPTESNISGSNELEDVDLRDVQPTPPQPTPRVTIGRAAAAGGAVLAGGAIAEGIYVETRNPSTPQIPQPNPPAETPTQPPATDVPTEPPNNPTNPTQPPVEPPVQPSNPDTGNPIYDLPPDQIQPPPYIPPVTPNQPPSGEIPMDIDFPSGPEPNEGKELVLVKEIRVQRNSRQSVLPALLTGVAVGSGITGLFFLA